MLPNLNESALLVIDMQNGFLREGGSCDRMGLPAAVLQPAVAPCQQLVSLARKASIPVIFTRYVYRKDFCDGGLMLELIPGLRDEGALVEDSEDAEIIAELKPAADELVLDKNRPSAFYATPLETWLNGLGVKDLVICGVTTNCCVETTVRDASQRDYRPWVVPQAVAEYDDQRHAIALQSMAMLFGYMIDLEEISAHWSLGS